MSKTKYTAYVELMLKILPHVAKEKKFNLKGGTAINLFVRNLPRLSVDIDLTYIGLESKHEAIKNAEASLSRIKSEIEKHIPKAKVLRPTKSSTELRNSQLPISLSYQALFLKNTTVSFN